MKKNDRKRLLWVGAFLLVGLLIMVTAIFVLGGKESKFAKYVTLNAVFENIEGLKPGNNIWLSGMKIGTVKELRFVRGNHILLTLRIEDAYSHLIKKDCVAKIGTDGLIGNKIVFIEGGSEEATVVSNHDTLSTEPNVDMSHLVANLQSNSENLTAIMENLKLITDNVVNEKGLLGSMVSNNSMNQELKTMLRSSQEVVKGIQTSTNNLHQFTAQLNNKNSSLNRIITDTDMYGSINGSVAQIEDAAVKINKASTTIDITADKFYEKDNVIGLIVNDKKAAADLKTTIQNTKQSSEKLDDNMEALRYNYFFRKGFKKMEKQKKTAPKLEEVPLK